LANKAGDSTGEKLQVYSVILTLTPRHRKIGREDGWVGGGGLRWDRTVALSKDSGGGAKDFSSSAKPNKTTPSVQLRIKK